MSSLSITRRSLLAASAGAALALPGRSQASATEFPGKRLIRIIAPTTPGGSADILARLLLPHMSSQLGTTMIVENVPGAGGTVGAARVARSEPDGYTLLLGFTSNIGTAPVVMRAVPYDPVRDFAPVGRGVSVNLCIVGNKELRPRDIQELIALARKRADSDPVMYGAWGAGSAAHLTMESVNFYAKAGMKLVPYKAEADVQKALLGNEVPLGVLTVGSVLPYLHDGTFKVLGIASKERSVLLPNVPTLAEQGIAFDTAAWLGVFAPANTPEPVLTRLADAMEFALRQPDVVERTRAIGMDIVSMSRRAFAESIPVEIEVWRRLAQAAGVQPQ